MQFTLTEEQELLRETVRAFLEHTSPLSAARERLEANGRYDAAVWQRLADELQLISLHVPEEAGGQGFGYVELGVVLEEMGRVLYPGPFLASAALAIPLLLAAGERGELLESALAGETVAAVALPLGGDSGARQVGREGAVALSGDGLLVVNGVDADVVLVAASVTDGTCALYAVRTADSGVVVDDGETLDPTRPLAQLTLVEAAGVPVGLPGTADGAIAQALPAMRASLAADLLGAASRALEITVDYVRERQQFGAPVGSFQAVQHQCADLLVAVEEARSAVYHALWAVTAESDEREVSSSVALAVALASAMKIGRASVHLHGGIGFTWEHDVHLFFRRAAAAPALLGSVDELRRHVAELSFSGAPLASGRGV